MSKREKQLGRHDARPPRERLTEALSRLVRLYDAWDKPEEAARWRKEAEDDKANLALPLTPPSEPGGAAELGRSATGGSVSEAGATVDEVVNAIQAATDFHGNDRLGAITVLVLLVATATGLLGAIAGLVLLVATATGNAYAMLGTSVTALILLAVFSRRQVGRGPILVALVAAATALVIGIVVAMR